MPAEIRFEEKLDHFQKTHIIPTGLRLWFNVLFYSFIIFVIFALYYFAVRGSLNIWSINRVFGDVSMILIGLSFALSGICYFWDFADAFIIYRKELGVVGLGYALIHTVIALTNMHNIFPLTTFFFGKENVIPFGSALIALIMYIGMVIISNRYLIRKIGGQTWRRLLRVGYIAYILSIIHFGILGYSDWLEWLVGKGSVMPPFGLLIFIFGIFVIGLRIVLFFATLKHARVPSGQTSTQPPTNV